MAEASIRLVAVPPGGRGLTDALRPILRFDTVVTAYDDARLRLVADLYQGDDEIEFVPFGDLLSRVLRMCGVATSRIVGRGQREAMTRLACESLTGDTKLDRSAKLPGMARLIGRNLELLRHHGIESEGLRTLSASSGTDQAERFAVMAEVADLVRDSMDVTHCEFLTDRVQSCLDQTLGECPVRHLVVVAGPDQQPLYDLWVGWLNGQGVSIDLVTDLIPDRSDLYLDSWATMARLSSPWCVASQSREWYEFLFTNHSATASPEVHVFNAPDPLNEVEWLLRKCAQRMDEEVPAQRIGVFVRDQELYVPLLVSTAEYLGVPLDASRTIPLLSCGISVAVIDVLKALASKDVRMIAKVAGTSYCPIDTKSRAALRDKTMDLARTGQDSWSELSDWALTLEDCPDWLTLSLDWRQRVATGAATLSVWLERFRQLIGSAALADMSVMSEEHIRSRDMRAQTVLQRSLADYAFVYDQAGRKELTLTNFVALATGIWEEETVTIEGSGKGVTLLFNASALRSYDTLYVPGMLEGSIPRRRREDPLLPDHDINHLADISGVRLPTSNDTTRKEREQFINLCAAAETRLVLSYPATDEERDNVPAFYIEELKRALPGQVKETTHRRNGWVPPFGESSLPRDRALREALDGPRVTPPAYEVVRGFARAKVRTDWETGVSPDELGAALTCPFQAAYRFRLDVKSPDRRITTSVLFDLPRRAKLTEAKTPEEALQNLAQALSDMIDRLYNALGESEAELLRSTGERLIVEWVEREFKARQLWPREGDASISDVAIGEHGLRNEVPIGGKTLRLQGKLAGVTGVQGLSVVQSFEQRAPNVENFRYDVENDSRAFVAGLNLMVQFGRGATGMALEIDMPGEGRNLVVLSTGRDTLRSDSVSGLRVQRIEGSRDGIFRAVRSQIRQAVDTLERADARAVPGEHCSRCLFAEICRHAPDTDPFQTA